ncbi:MAG TPA: phosphatidylglycerol lysyltransferase domain-containing protein [Acidobacteriota bacterium]|nr:phosphatidylglycerol lysyltransferase domain-containing protein [Acidobacteriota bacterium]HMZ79618.1 phosphatidylglycerol lysyltransferase domain-containing protein [Acidobacteriota bacterium]HNJ40527.1 phosphatidylglycerol lysyltransferase domain-containing protein [Acidobacteriota bacterium]
MDPMYQWRRQASHSLPPEHSSPRQYLAHRFQIRPWIRRIWESHAIIWIVTLATLGSGILNIYSVIGPGLPYRVAILKEIFPLQFLPLSRLATLLIGMALVVVSLNIYKRKTRAWYSVLLLASLSVMFHLTKGIDYEEALCSACLIGLLALVKARFQVKSSIPTFPSALLRLGLVCSVVLLYGVAGFWLLEPREFGVNFTLAHSIHHTLNLLMLANEGLSPHTRYARWFLESFDWLTISILFFGFWELYKPVIYRFRTHPQECEQARGIVEAHGRSALDYFKTWADKTFYFSETGHSFLAYRVSGRFALVLADPVGPEAEIEPLLRGFLKFCEENDWNVGFYQTLPDFLPIYQRLKFQHLKLGVDAVVDLATFSLSGSRMKKLRHLINHLEKEHITFSIVTPPVAPEVMAQLSQVSNAWLGIPGRRERQFALGQFDVAYLQTTPIALAVDATGSVLAFANLIPSFSPGEATIDLMRHRPDAPNGIMDFLLINLFWFCRDQGYQRFNLGLIPLLGQPNEVPTIGEKTLHRVSQPLQFFFSFEGLKRFKGKYATSWESRYAVFRTPFDFPLEMLAFSQLAEFHQRRSSWVKSVFWQPCAWCFHWSRRVLLKHS